MNDMSILKEFCNKYHNYDLIKEPGIVCHVYSDGEVTLQKSGNLYKQRSEHIIEYGFNNKINPDLFPMKTPDNNFGYIITKFENSHQIRQIIKNIIANNLNSNTNSNSN